MMYRITWTGGMGGSPPPTDLEGVRSIREDGFEGRWLVFLDSKETEMLRVETRDVDRVTLVLGSE